MRFVFGIAGVPADFFDHVHAHQKQIVLDNSEFWGKPLQGASYTDTYGGVFLNHFADLIRHDHHEHLADTCFAVIFLEHDAQSTERFRAQLFPATLSLPAIWKPTFGSKQQVATSGNALVSILRDRVQAAKTALKTLTKEVRDRSNRTPLLLPVRNFHSKILVEMLQTIQRDTPGSPSPDSFLRDVMADFENAHRAEHADDHLYQFRDDRSIAFKAPGRACHAFARPSWAHPDTCILSGRRRLGAPYNRAFHYDCLKKQGHPLKGAFFGCHEASAERCGDPHLNIAPNDFVRA